MSRTPCEEDDYDFDYLLGTSKDTCTRSRTYTLDEYGNPIRPRNRAKIPQDNVVKLPPVLVGQTRNQTRPRVDITAMAKDRRVRQTTATMREPDLSDALQRERDKLKAQRQLQNEYSTGPSYHPYYERKPVSVVQTGTAHAHDRKLIDYRIPPTVDRHRSTDHIDQEPYRPSFSNDGLGQTRTTYNVYTPDHHQNTSGDRLTAHKDNLKPIEGLRYYAPVPPAALNHNKSYTNGDNMPAPPTCKPSDNQSYNKTRRQLKYRNQGLDKDIPIYKPEQAFISKPSAHTCISEFVDDFDQEIIEAVEMENKFAALNDKVRLLKNECNGFATGAGRKLATDNADKFLDELDDILENPTSARPNSVAAANRNLDGCTTPLRMPAAAVVPHMSKEPSKQWNGQTAKRGVGFKSKLKKIEPKIKHAGDDIIPDRVRQRMNKYLS